MLEIVRYPDPRLREPSVPIASIDDEIRALAEAMIETMYAARGVGLAAPQVGVNRRLVVIDLDPETRDPHVFINPVVTKKGRDKATEDEGCLSLPGITAKVTRPAEAVLRATTLEGEAVELSGGGLFARAAQHETDHLDGILFIDKVSRASRFRLRDELARLEQAFAARADG